MELDEEEEFNRFDGFTDKICYFLNPEMMTKIRELRKNEGNIFTPRKPTDNKGEATAERREIVKAIIQNKLKRDPIDLGEPPIIETAEDQNA